VTFPQTRAHHGPRRGKSSEINFVVLMSAGKPWTIGSLYVRPVEIASQKWKFDKGAVENFWEADSLGEIPNWHKERGTGGRQGRAYFCGCQNSKPQKSPAPSLSSKPISQPSRPSWPRQTTVASEEWPVAPFVTRNLWPVGKPRSRMAIQPRALTSTVYPEVSSVFPSSCHSTIKGTRELSRPAARMCLRLASVSAGLILTTVFLRHSLRLPRNSEQGTLVFKLSSPPTGRQIFSYGISNR